MNYLSTKPQAHGHTEEQWQARVDLAAAHRCAVMHNLHEGIFNHLTFRVPATKIDTIKSHSVSIGQR